jgi:hypothetical protein
MFNGGMLAAVPTIKTPLLLILSMVGDTFADPVRWEHETANTSVKAKITSSFSFFKALLLS